MLTMYISANYSLTKIKLLLICNSAVLLIWLGLGTKNHLVWVRKISCFLALNTTAQNCPKVTLKILCCTWKQHYGETALHYMAPLTVSECNTTVVNFALKCWNCSHWFSLLAHYRNVLDRNDTFCQTINMAQSLWHTHLFECQWFAETSTAIEAARQQSILWCK